MLLEGKDAGAAALMVGSESGSQFNREYKRQFGASPRKDIAKNVHNLFTHFIKISEKPI